MRGISSISRQLFHLQRFYEAGPLNRLSPPSVGIDMEPNAKGLKKKKKNQIGISWIRKELEQMSLTFVG